MKSCIIKISTLFLVVLMFATAGCSVSEDPEFNDEGTPEPPEIVITDPIMYTVTATANTGGTLSPASSEVESGSTTDLTVTTNSGFQIDSVSGCSGNLFGSTYTTGAVTADCTVQASFSPINVENPLTYTVTATSNNGGSLSPASTEVDSGSTTNLMVTTNSGFQIDSITGCSGSLSGNTYTTGAVTADCAIEAVFIPLVVEEPSPCLDSENTTEGCGGLLPNRLSGVAPLYVFFEPDWGDEDVQTAFHTYQIDWNYGDGDLGTWPTTGGAKVSHRGPYGAHVFETPGTFVTTAVLKTPAGDEITQTATIVVEDPNEVFAGQATVCVSRAGNFDGAPAGCKQVTTSSMSTAASELDSGVRLLFRRGESWTGARFDINMVGPGHVGAFGSGENPEFEITGTAFSISDGEPLADDWRITDLTLLGNNPAGAIGVDLDGETHNLLLQRLKMRDVRVGVKASINILDHYNEVGKGPHEFHDSVALVEIDLERVVGGSGANGIFFISSRTALMGNRFYDSTEAEHIWRIPFMDKAVLIHNDLGRQRTQKSVIKLHGPDFVLSGLGNGRHTQLIQIADNIFRSENAAWSVNIGPQNEAIDQRAHDIIVERNHFLTDSSTQVILNMWAQYITARNNLMDATGSEFNGLTCIEASHRGVEPPPKEVHIYNNTCYRNSNHPISLANMNQATDSSLRNNVLVSLQSTPSLGGIGSNVQSNNILSQTTFFSANPTDPADFIPGIATDPDNAAMVIEGLTEDFFGNPRSVTTPDIGAFEN